MKAQYLLILFLIISLSAGAQDSGNNNIPGPQDSIYHRQRIAISEPPFNLDKIRKIINDIPPKPTYTTINLDEKIFNSLTLREKFAYNTIHLEFYNYIPEKDPVYKNEDSKIFAQLPNLFGGRGWSSEQGDFFSTNSDSICKLIKEDIQRTNRIGLNYKQILVDINAKEMIPFLIDFYNKERKDHDILTVMLLMMGNHNYTDLVTSPEYVMLYGAPGIFQGEHLVANKVNEDLIMKWALDYSKGPSPESQQYSQYRDYISEPPYGLAKIKKITASLLFDGPVGEEEGDDIHRPAAKVYQSFTFREKFTYHILFAESYSQNCDGPPTLYNEDKKIFAHLPDLFLEQNWSARQVKFLNTYRDSLVKFIKEDVIRTSRIGLNYKHAIVEANATALIPFLVEFYKKERKDHDILTVLMLLMENNKYPEFKASISHKKLYDEGAPGDYYNRHLVLNTANEDLIMQRATDFYNKWRKK